MIESLHPFRSLTIPCAVVTGILLWLSSQIGGWFEHRALSRGSAVSGRAYGIASSISLGVLFSVIPVLGSTLGIALDVRHMTLSAGAFLLAVCSSGIHEAWHAGLPAAALGLLVITVLNLGVSFFLGLMTAVHARGLDRSVIRSLFRDFEIEHPKAE